MYTESSSFLCPVTLLITLVFGGSVRQKALPNDTKLSFAERYKVMLIRKQIYGCTVIEETTCGGGKGGGGGGQAHANCLSGEQRCRD